MADVRTGMRLRSTVNDWWPDILVTEITADGFRYVHEPVLLSPRIGTTDSGEHFGAGGEALYEPSEGA